MKSPKIVVVTGWRWEDPFMVDDWKENTKWADGHVVYDDRDRDPSDRWIDESFLYSELRKRAIEQDADWILHLSLDERLDRSAEQTIRERINYLKRSILRFPIREMYSPTHYRVDKGFWQHQESRAYPLFEDSTYSNDKFHNPIVPQNDPWMKKQSVPCNIYHLKHIEPENIQERVKIYNQVDPGAKYSILENYEYLLNDKNISLTPLKPNEGYDPPYRPFKYNTGASS